MGFPSWRFLREPVASYLSTSGPSSGTDLHRWKWMGSSPKLAVSLLACTSTRRLTQCAGPNVAIRSDSRNSVYFHHLRRLGGWISLPPHILHLREKYLEQVRVSDLARPLIRGPSVLRSLAASSVRDAQDTVIRWPAALKRWTVAGTGLAKAPPRAPPVDPSIKIPSSSGRPDHTLVKPHLPPHLTHLR
jgi:hypothetical protein